MVSTDLSHSPFSLAGKRALVTGGATGIGAAIAAGLARAGADVAITTNNSPGEATLVAVRDAGREAFALPLDLGSIDARSARAALDRLAHEFGAIDILVNNAGIIRRGNAIEHAEADWRDVLSVDLDAVWYLSQAAARRMMDRGSGGRIVNIASLLSFQGGIRVPGYAAAKHGVVGLTKALANEWAPRGIGVNAIAPGYIATDNTAPLRADEARSQSILARIPVGRWGDPSDLAGACVFLASPAASYVHGHVLTVDGGWMAR